LRLIEIAARVVEMKRKSAWGYGSSNYGNELKLAASAAPLIGD
jgi:hypothetical protein